jgi:hypothetical protein
MNCKGCKTKINTIKFKNITTCIIETNAPKRKCPCELCVVKPMCSIQCKPFYDLVVSIFKMSISYDYKGVCKGSPNFRTLIPYYNRCK